MRTGIALLLLLPLLAGCAGPETQIEAFRATYTVPGGVVTVDFGQVVRYLAADGSLQEGYSLRVQHTTPSTGIGFEETILDADLQRVRRMDCAGEWLGGTCTLRWYDWSIGPDEPLAFHAKAFSLHPDLDLSPVGQNATFDHRLAPTSFPTSTDWALRTDYVSRGPLPPLAQGRVLPLAVVPVDGAGWPGDDVPLFGVPYSLRQAIDYLEADNADAARMLAEGACVRQVAVDRHVPSDPPTGAMPFDQDEGRVLVSLTNSSGSRSFTLAYGRAAPFGEQGFLRTWPGGMLGRAVVDCDARPPVAAFPDGLALLDRVLPEHGFVSMAWEKEDDAEAPRLFLYTRHAFELRPESVRVDAGRGLDSWRSPASIDPAPS